MTTTDSWAGRLANHSRLGRLAKNSWLGQLARRARNWNRKRRDERYGVVRIVNDLPLRVLPSHEDQFYSHFDSPVAALLRRRVKPGMMCFNVGANVGIYALQFAHWCGPDGRVVAFEPNPLTIEVLKRHIDINGFTARIRVVESAVSAAPGAAAFHFAGTNGMSRLGAPNPLLQQTEAITVDVTSLDAFCARERVWPDALVMDIEGAEIAALEGARQLIQARRDTLTLVVEMHSECWKVFGTTRADLEKLLKEFRLKPVPLTGQADPLLHYGMIYLEPY